MSKDRTIIITVRDGVVDSVIPVENGIEIDLDFDYLIVDFDYFDEEYEEEMNRELGKIVQGLTMESLS